MNDTALALQRQGTTDTPAPVGDNQPPLDAIVELEIDADRTTAAALLESFGSSLIVDDASAAEARKLATQLGDHAERMDAARKLRKEPFERGVKLVDGAWMPIIKSLKDARGSIRDMLDTYVKRRDADAAAERARIQAAADEKAEQATKKAAEAQALAGGGAAAKLQSLQLAEEAEKLGAQAEAIRPAPIRTDLGSVGSRPEIGFEITDLPTCLRGLLKTHRAQVLEAVEGIVKRHLTSLGVKHVETANVPGVRAWVGRKATLASR